MLKHALMGMLTLMMVCAGASAQADPWATAARNAGQASEAFGRCHRVVDFWYTKTGKNNYLLPRGLDERTWEGNDGPADQWSFFVCASYLTGDARMEAEVHNTLLDDIRLTTRVGRMGDLYDIDANKFVRSKVDLERVIFSSAEYVKDGLMPIIDLTGQKVYVDRARKLLEDIMYASPIKTHHHGNIPDDHAEACGDMLQSLSRLYCATGDARFKQFAESIGEAWMFEVLPTNNGLPCHRWDFTKGKPISDLLSLSDHGNEIIFGLTELLLLEYTHDQDKFQKYLPPIQGMVDKLLKVGVNDEGLWYGAIEPTTGKAYSKTVPDTWGYVLNAVYAMYLVTGQTKYRDAAQKAMLSIATNPQYEIWTGGYMDSHADAIESGIFFYNRIREPKMLAWIDKMMPPFLARQQPNGNVQGTYLDGNYVRTSLMWALMKTCGAYVQDWRADVKVGAVADSGRLYVQVSAARPWKGLLKLDSPRYRENLGLTIDYPRINQFPQWYAIEPTLLYQVSINGVPLHEMLGDDLIQGLPLNVGTKPVRILVRRVDGPPYGVGN